MFNYKNDVMFCENIDLAEINKTVNTPFYCYSYNMIKHNYLSLVSALKNIGAMICFAVKANSNLAVLNLLAKLGSGFDTVSEGEIRRVIKAGGDANKIVFSGVGKTEHEITYALEVGIKQFNVESWSELESINQIAQRMNKIAHIAFRVNPNVDAETLNKISTGKEGDKFGIDLPLIEDYFKHAKNMSNISAKGLSVHIGSQIVNIEPFRKAFKTITDKTRDLIKAGYTIDVVDFGGGIGICYKNEHVINLKDYAQTIEQAVRGITAQILVEPGRLIVGNAGVLVTKVIYIKKTATKKIIIVDAGQNDLIRPALYGSYHTINPYCKTKQTEVQDLVGPICETSDTFAKDRVLPKCSKGDLLVIQDTGAYGFTMASNYNTKLMPAEILVNDNKFSIIHKQDNYDDILDRDIIPEF